MAELKRHNRRQTRTCWLPVALALVVSGGVSWATPANKAALVKHYDVFLAKGLNRCTTCHLPSENKNPETLEEFPHNAFGDRLRKAGKELTGSGKAKDIGARLERVAREDSDGDGVDNGTELLLGHSPGDAKDTPVAKELAEAKKRRDEFTKYLGGYRWQPYEMVQRPVVPAMKGARWVKNPVDAFIASEHEARKLKPRPEASREVLLRRVYLDLIGLSPTPGELLAFENDKSADAFEKVVDRLLASPRYGERWGRHWMDVWRYSDWAGYKEAVRDSKPFIWRWRDWIVESLNADKGYDRMITEMLAADEASPLDPEALRATGFLVRNFKAGSREKWLEDTVSHTAQAFLGVTMGCAKCHDHMYDPISQREYYEFRAIFEPHNLRTDRVPGQLDVTKDGLPRAYDAAPTAATYILRRGEETKPDKTIPIAAGVPGILGGALKVTPVALPEAAYRVDKQPSFIKDTLAANEKAVADAHATYDQLKADPKTGPDRIGEVELALELAKARRYSFSATLQAEQLEGQKSAPEWKSAALGAVEAQRKLAVLEARQSLATAEQAVAAARTKIDKQAKTATVAVVDKNKKDMTDAKKKVTDAEKALAAAQKEAAAAPGTAYKPRPGEKYQPTSTGRRLALAGWLASPENPLTARVAMNHLWAHHFGQGIVPTLNEFGRNGKAPSHPQLLDWLAAEFMAQGWSLKAMHRLMVTSSTYRMASTTDRNDAKLDPENTYWWRMPSRRLEAEAVRDNLLHVGGTLDLTMGGPDIDNKLGLTSKRRSIYLRIAPEKEVEFLKIFDGPSVTECYTRKTTVMPHQALALANNELTFAQAKQLAGTLTKQAPGDREFVTAAYERVLSRHPKKEELRECTEFLKSQAGWLREQAPPTAAVMAPTTKGQSTGVAQARPEPAARAREDLLLVLMNHNEFVTVR